MANNKTKNKKLIDPSNSSQISRRSFLGIGASAAALAAGSALTACSPSALVSNSAIDNSNGTNGTTGTTGIAANDTSTPSFLQIPDTIPDSSIKETVEAEIVIIGAGLSGLCAARAIAENISTTTKNTDTSLENTNPRIVVIEKSDTYQFRSNQFGTINSSIQKDLEISIDKTAVVGQLMKECGYRPNQRLLNLWADHSGEAFDWFLEPCEGDFVIEEERAPYDGKSQSVRKLHWPHPEDSKTENNFYPIFDTCQITLPDMGPYLKKSYQFCLDRGVEFRFSTWARQLIREDNGRIEGVVVEGSEGNYRKILASHAVLLATGDYSGNEEMLQYYSPWAARFESIFPNTDAGDPSVQTNTGDGHRIAMWAGARMEDGPHAPMTHHLGGPLGVDGFLLVDIDGNRFTNEDVSGQALQNQLSRLPGRTAWQIFDSKWKEQIGHMDTGHGNVNWYVEKGSEVPNGSYGKNAYISEEDNEDGNTPGFDSYFSEEADGVIAEDYEDLAIKIGMDVEVLTETITRYNSLADHDKDSDFGKRADRLFPIVEPPFYAYRFTDTALLVVMGGLVTNSEFQVLDVEDQVIEGLYAVGNVQGGRFLVDYPLAAPGISHGMALTHGMLVGRSLALLIHTSTNQETEGTTADDDLTSELDEES